MNGYQRVKCALQGGWPDRVPILLHNFMMAAREYGCTMREYRSSPRKIADTFIHSIEKYQYDGICVDVDTATLAGTVGVPVDFPENEPARCVGGCLRSLEEVKDLPPVDISTRPRVEIWLEAVRLLKEHFRDEIYIRGNCDQCPFSLAALMRTQEQWMLDLTDESHQEQVFDLLAYCENITRQFIALMAQTGAHAVSNGDSSAGPAMISPTMYRRYAFPYEQNIAAHAHRLGKLYILHICGKTQKILNDLTQVGVNGIELDYKTDAQQAHQILKDQVTFFGNIDPSGVLALGTRDLVIKKTHELLEVFSDTPRFVLNAGCAIPALTPSENIHALIQTARAFR